MSSRRTTPIMNSSRPRTSVEATRKPRHTSRTQLEPVNTSFSTHYPSAMTQTSYLPAPGSPDFYSGDNQCWSMMTNSFYPGNDSAHIPTLSVAPTDLTHQPCWEAMTTYEPDMSSVSSGLSSKSCITPPLSQAEMLPYDVFQPSLDHSMDQYDYYPDRYMTLPEPLTPPEDPMFEMHTNDKNESLVFPDTECEYMGVSKIQFSRFI